MPLSTLSRSSRRIRAGERRVRRGRVRAARRAADRDRASRGAGRPARAPRLLAILGSPARAGSLHRDVAARHHGRQPRARHVRRARARRLALAAPRICRHDASLIGARRSRRSLAVALLTFVHIVVGEMVPKSLALQHAEGVGAHRRTGRCAWRSSLPYPLVTMLNATARTRACGSSASGGSTTSHEQFHTPEELQLIVEESERGGALRSEAGHLRKELFEFGDLTAGAGDGAARPRRRHSHRRVARRHSRASRQASAHAVPGLRRRPRSHRRHAAREGSAAAAHRRASRSPLATCGRCRSCRKPRRSTTC